MTTPSDQIDNLLLACSLAETRSVVDALRNITFSKGRVSAFNGVLFFSAPFSLVSSSGEEAFAVSESKLARALRQSGGTESEFSSTKDFLKIKTGPLSVKVRKLSAESAYLPEVFPPASSGRYAEGAEKLVSSMKSLLPFVSEDASRPWSRGVLLSDDGFFYATNNLALVRLPAPKRWVKKGTKVVIPRETVEFISQCTKRMTRFEVSSSALLMEWQGGALASSPQSAAEGWPEPARFFSDFPASMPTLPKDLSLAAEAVSGFADRFTSLSSMKVESKEHNLEAEYEVSFEKGRGKYSAKLLSLILSYATHADFSFYPKPIFFSSAVSGLQGTAVGAREEAAT